MGYYKVTIPEKEYKELVNNTATLDNLKNYLEHCESPSMEVVCVMLNIKEKRSNEHG